MERWNANPSGWDSLRNFMGTVPDEHLLVLLTRNRDSDILSESNWHTVLEYLGGESDSVQIIRHGHWACGWIEYLMIDSRDAEKRTLGEQVESRLADYPVFNEDDWSNREYEAACTAWEEMSVRTRVEIIQKYGGKYVSVFAARREWIPENDNGNIQQYLVQ
jgi:hypothetical protein